MTVEEWCERNFAMLFLLEAMDTRDPLGDTTDVDWRVVAAIVGCLTRLGELTPAGVRDWLARAGGWLDLETRTAMVPERLLRDPEVFAAFRRTYEVVNSEDKQRIAAAQDVFLCSDSYYCYEQYLLEVDDSHPTYNGPVYSAESKAHCDIIRDIFGNPFHPVAFDPAWRTSTAVGIATAIYEDRAFDRMPILSDALQDAGCENEHILAHCRGDGPHVRGCWVVDLVLGKE